MKDIYKHFNNIDFNIEEINSISVEIDDITKKRIKNNLRNSIKSRKPKKIVKTGIAVCIASFVVLFSIGFSNSPFTAFAENIPVLNSLFEKFSTIYGGDFKDYTQVIDKSQKDNGYEVTINEVAIDDLSFKLIYTIKTDEKLSELDTTGSMFPYTLGKHITINGESFIGGSGGDNRTIDEYTIQVIEDFDLIHMDIPESCNMEIDFREINSTKGNWKFKFNISKEKISKDIKTFTPKEKLHIKDATITFDTISFSPISTAIKFTGNSSKIDYTKLIFKDENGNVIEPISSGIGGDLNKFIGFFSFKPIEKIPNKIIVEYKGQESCVELILK